MTQKSLTWVGTSLSDIRALPDEARRQLGFDLREVQRGNQPRDWKPMNSIDPGAIEIRVSVAGAFRLIYVAKFAESIYVLHVFQKKSAKTSRFDLAIARARYAAIRSLRQRR